MEKTEKGKINFSRVERALLLDLVDKHKAVLENKRTDAVSVARKRKEWELIETQFNSSHNVSPRTWLQLKKCWENWKNKWRKAKADDNREIFKTGGGSAAPASSLKTCKELAVSHPTWGFAWRTPSTVIATKQTQAASPNPHHQWPPCFRALKMVLFQETVV
ncbi:myb/SANT-like DNA-binding domain-containing protein 3 [Amblyomma americanum]